MQEMKYFNEGNDCDICKNKIMTGRDGTVEDCWQYASDFHPSDLLFWPALSMRGRSFHTDGRLLPVSALNSHPQSVRLPLCNIHRHILLT